MRSEQCGNRRDDDVAARNLIPAQVASNSTCPDAPPTPCLAGARRRLRGDENEAEHVYVVLGSMVPTAAPKTRVIARPEPGFSVFAT